MLDKGVTDRDSQVFVEKFNSVTGANGWEFLPETFDYHQEVARAAYADMLHDEDRNRRYYEAIQGAVERVHADGRKANVLDIGTGTGLLSMMAARCGADSVIACEAFPPMAACARDIIKLNGLEEKIHVISKRSLELKVGPNADLKSRCNILVTEVFDTELIGEGAFQTFDHAYRELLERNSIVVPHSATIYAQIVESPLTHSWNRLKDVYDDEGHLLLKVPPCVRTCPGATSVHDLQMSQLDVERVRTLVPPIAVLHFDWTCTKPLKYREHARATVEAVRDGCAQAVFMWWELQMDAGDATNVLSCAPRWAHAARDELPWRDHWMQAIYYFPKELSVRAGQQLQLISSHDEYTIWFAVTQGGVPARDADHARPLCECNLHLAHSRTRLGQINDGTRLKKYQSVYRKHMDKDSVVLLLGNGFYTSLAAWRMAKKLIYVDDSYLSRSVLQSFIAHNNIDNVEIFDDVDELKSKFDVASISLVISDEHYKTSVLPWDNLMFAYQIKEITDQLREDVKIIPKVVTIKALAVEFEELQKTHAPIQNCEGFNMTPYDELINNSSRISDDLVEVHPLWEYPCTSKSDVTHIADVSAELVVAGENLETRGFIMLEGDRRYNGVALWMEWDLDGSESNRITSGPIVPPVIGERVQWDMHVRQGAVVFPRTTEGHAVTFRFKFHVADGKITFKFNV